MIHVGLTLGGSWSSGNDTESGVNRSPGSMPESLRERANGKNMFNTKDDNPTTALETTSSKAVAVTVGVPRRFGNPVGSSEDTPKLQETPDDAATNFAKLRHMLKKVRVNEASLYTAIERLGGGGKGLKAVIDYIIQFQGLKERNAECLDCDLFSEGLEELCLKSENKSSEKEKEVRPVHTIGHYHNDLAAAVQSTADENPEKEVPPMDTIGHYHNNLSSAFYNTIDLEPHRATFDLERQQVHNSMSHGLGMPARPVGWNSQGQENWSHGGHYVDPRRAGMVEHPPFVGAYFPNFYCPYPPPYTGYVPFNPCVQPIFLPFMAGPNVCPPSVENAQSAAIIRASRKIRIAKHRGNINGHQQTRPTTVIGSGSPISGLQRKSQAQPNLPLTTAEQACCLSNLTFHYQASHKGQWFVTTSWFEIPAVKLLRQLFCNLVYFTSRKDVHFAMKLYHKFVLCTTSSTR